MIEIDFGPFGGGFQSFANIPEAVEFMEGEALAWTTDKAFQDAVRARPTNEMQQIGHLGSPWRSLAGDLKSRASVAGNAQQVIREWNTARAATSLVAHASEAGALMRRLVGESQQEAWGAYRYLTVQPSQTIMGETGRPGLLGMLAAWAIEAGLDPVASAKARDGYKDARARLNGSLKKQQIDFDEFMGRAQAAMNETSVSIQEMQEVHHEAQNRRADEHLNAQSFREREWKTTHAHYTEQMKLRAAVVQWSQRAVGHEASFKTQRKWTIAIGAGGLIVAVFWSWGALSLAHWLFAEALVQGSPVPKPGTLRPTWIHELIFAASASVLYLTLFLWLMRLMVRMLMSEHHLGIDARGRESMAHTYLALLEDKGATSDADRAIVLGALFRPITDGLVKDDALPLISPASILSAMAAKPA